MRADLVYNRRQRETPSVFKPRHYFPLLGESLFRSVMQQYTATATTRGALSTVSHVFRMLSEKLIRIGQTSLLLQSWLSGAASALYDPRVENVHRLLLASLPESCHEAFLLQLSKQEAADKQGQKKVGQAPKYRLVSLIPQQMALSKQFQYVVTHKLLLKRPFEDFFFLRALIDVLARAGGYADGETMASVSAETPLSLIFDVVVTRWSQSAFAGTADYALNTSICFFLRYSIKLLAQTSAFSRRDDWVPKLCKGVQDHMNHSLERTRILGMRVGETLSLVISPENPLNFEITESEDPMEIYGNVAFDASDACDLADAVDSMSLSGDSEAVGMGASQSGKASRRAKKTRKATSKPFALDPDEIVDSDDDNDESEEEATAGSDGNDSDSDMSLDAYNMEDDEEDLTAKRPVYLKDLIAGLHAEDDREKTEAALAEAEALLRKKPRDLHENATAVVTALLRLEDKYSTPNFTALRANALAAACAISPLKTIPYFHSQALEREQLLQSRIDVLQAMVAASQELAEVGDIFKVAMIGSQKKKSLLNEDLDARTTRELKTRRWGYRRDPLAQPKKNAFAEYALRFFSPLLFGYIEYVRTHSSPASKTSLSDLENVFLAHLLHTLGVFVECAGNAPQAIAMAKCLLEFAWVQRLSGVAAVRRQVIFSISRVLLVVPPFLLRQEMGESVVEMLAWLQQVNRQDPDEGCREGSRLLLSSGAIPMLSL